MLLPGKLALVTGAGSGIGRAISQTFAKQGATVVLADVNRTGIEETKSSLSGSDHFCVHADISSSSFAAQLNEIILKQFARPPDILVNNAGITKDALLHKMTEEQWNWVIAVNLSGPFLLTQVITKQMLKSGLTTGSIINLSSIVGKIGNVGQTNYSAAKAGVIGLTKSIAKELGPRNIRCNAVLPGFIRTPMTAVIPQKISEVVKQQIPLGARMGTPEEVANVCLFLASELSSYVTGAVIEVTGGMGM